MVRGVGCFWMSFDQLEGSFPRKTTLNPLIGCSSGFVSPKTIKVHRFRTQMVFNGFGMRHPLVEPSNIAVEMHKANTYSSIILVVY